MTNHEIDPARIRHRVATSAPGDDDEALGLRDPIGAE